MPTANSSANSSVARPIVLLRATLAVLLGIHGYYRALSGGATLFGGYLRESGIPAGAALAWGITLFEMIGSILLLLGRWVPWVASGHALILIGGIVLVHGHEGWFVVGGGRNGVEYSVLLLVSLAVVAWSHRLALAVGLAVLLHAGGATAATPRADALADQVRATERAFAATMAQRDHSAFSAFLADDAVFISESGVLRGKAAVAQAWRRYYDGATAPFSWEPERVEVLDSGTLALSTGPVRDPQGRLIATFNSIWRQESAGRWRIVFDKGAAVCPPAAVAPDPTAKPVVADLIRGLPAYARDALAAWRAPGMAIAVVQDGRVVLAQGFGQRAVDQSAPVDAHTRFATASLTKGFTAAVAAAQVHAGGLLWDEPIVAKLPGFALHDPRVTAELTLRDVLAHRGGLDDSADLLWLGTGYDQDEVLQRLRAVPQASPLRSTFSYSNVLYVAAGKLVAQSAGSPWEDVIRTRLFGPLGMRDSGFGVPQASDGNWARPHAEHDGSVRPIAPRDVHNIAPAAAVYSSAADMARWLLLLLGRGEIDGKRILEAGVVDTLHTPQTLVGLAPWQQSLYPESNFLAQGMGFMLQDYRGQLVAWGTGGIDGYACSLAVVPKARLGIVVLANVPWTGLPEGIVFWLIDRALGGAHKDWSTLRLSLSLQSRARRADAQRKQVGPRELQTWPLPPPRLIGRYRNELLGDAVVGAAPHRAAGSPALSLRIARSLHAVLEPWRAGVLRILPDDPQIDAAACSYSLGPDGQVRNLVLGDWGTFQRVVADRQQSR